MNILLKFIGAIISITGTVGFFFVPSISGQLGVVGGMVTGAVSGVVVFLGVSLIKYSKKLTAKESANSILKDKRHPVVYLRSFNSDAEGAFGAASFLPFGLSDLVSEEEYLAKALNDIGPVIAIGRPGEKLPQLGAVRKYVKDEHWQSEVSKLLENSRLVVIRIGLSKGILWEIDACMKLLKPKQLVLMVPKDLDQYEVFKNNVNEIMRYPLPKVNKKKAFRAGSINGLIYFDKEWQPHYKHMSRIPLIYKQTLNSAYKFTLQPIYNQLELEWSKPSFNIAAILGILIFVLMFAAVL